MPLELFRGKAVVLDLRHIPDLGTIDVPEVEAAEKASGVRIDGHIVLLNTGLHLRHYPRDTVMTSSPGLTAAATHWMADRHSRRAWNRRTVDGSPRRSAVSEPSGLSRPRNRALRAAL